MRFNKNDIGQFYSTDRNWRTLHQISLIVSWIERGDISLFEGKFSSSCHLPSPSKYVLQFRCKKFRSYCKQARYLQCNFENIACIKSKNQESKMISCRSIFPFIKESDTRRLVLLNYFRIFFSYRIASHVFSYSAFASRKKTTATNFKLFIWNLRKVSLFWPIIFKICVTEYRFNVNIVSGYRLLIIPKNDGSVSI